MELFTIDPGLAIWTWIVFGIMFGILWKFAFPGLLNNIKDREEKIAQSVNKATAIEKRLSSMEAEREEMLNETKVQATEILRQTREQADALKKELFAKAEAEAKEILKAAKIKIEDERAAMLESLRENIADFVCETSEKIVERSFVEKNDRDWVKELVEKL